MTRMDWAFLIDFRAFAALQAGGFLAELAVYALARKERYPWREAWRSLAIGVPAFVVWGLEIQLCFQLFRAAEPYRLFEIPPGWGKVALTFLAAELHFYATHRLQHRVHWLWADHRVHHSTTDLNVFDGNRLGWTVLFAGGFNTLFLPFVLLGFSPVELIGFSSLILYYQFFIHTKVIPRLGLLEGLFNTPGNHRAHHASNLRYLDRNYGGMTVLFDRLFGTFEPERAEEPVRFGLWEADANKEGFSSLLLAGWAGIWKAFRRENTLRGKALALFGPPGWSSDGSTLTTDQLRAREQQPGERKEAA